MGPEEGGHQEAPFRRLIRSNREAGFDACLRRNRRHAVKAWRRFLCHRAKGVFDLAWWAKASLVRLGGLKGAFGSAWWAKASLVGESASDFGLCCLRCTVCDGVRPPVWTFGHFFRDMARVCSYTWRVGGHVRGFSRVSPGGRIAALVRPAFPWHNREKMAWEDPKMQGRLMQCIIYAYSI